jgi:hypothetical protein
MTKELLHSSLLITLQHFLPNILLHSKRASSEVLSELVLRECQKPKENHFGFIRLDCLERDVSF